MTIETIYIRTAETRSIPKSHVVYKIEVHSSTSRTWHVWRRYSEFACLHESFATTPPFTLPKKYWFNSSVGNAVQIEERRRGLELYLRNILSNSNTIWRKSEEFMKFLNFTNYDEEENSITSEKWIELLNSTQAMTRQVRGILNKKETASNTTEVHNAGANARKFIFSISAGVSTLEKGLEILAGTPDIHGNVLSDGEYRRRLDLVNALKREKDQITKLMTGTGISISTTSMFMNNTNISNIGRGRTLGKPLEKERIEETDITCSLDNVDLVQLQTNMITEQDNTLEEFSTILKRQKELGLAIGNELDLQNQMLDNLNDDLDHIGGKLKGARIKLNKIS